MFKLINTTTAFRPWLLRTRHYTGIPVQWWPTLENPWAEGVTSPAEDKFITDNKVDYEISTEEFKWVSRCLRPARFPLPPQNCQFPTPSGWVPPNPTLSKGLPYSVRRSRNHLLPVYFSEKPRKLREKTHGTRQLTVIKNVDGDMWALAEELRTLLEPTCPGNLFLCQIDEATRKILIEGIFLQQVSDFLLSKGF